MGFVKAQSKPSLISGLVFGVALLASGLGVWNGSRQALVIAEVLAVILMVVMGIRFARTKKFMPAGLMAGMSLLVAIVLVLR